MDVLDISNVFNGNAFREPRREEFRLLSTERRGSASDEPILTDDPERDEIWIGIVGAELVVRLAHVVKFLTSACGAFRQNRAEHRERVFGVTRVAFDEPIAFRKS